MSRLLIGGNLILDERYRTTETKTGATWTDGKPIYRKVVTFTTQNASPGTNTVALGITNRALITHVEVFVQNSTGIFYPFSFYVSSSGNYSRFYISGTSTNNLVIYFQNSDMKNQPGYCIVEYTKTTD